MIKNNYPFNFEKMVFIWKKVFIGKIPTPQSVLSNRTATANLNNLYFLWLKLLQSFYNFLYFRIMLISNFSMYLPFLNYIFFSTFRNCDNLSHHECKGVSKKIYFGNCTSETVRVFSLV